MSKHRMAEMVIKDTLHKRKLNYEAICAKLGISKYYFNKCMDGKSKLKTPEFISLCVFLGLKVEDFR